MLRPSQATRPAEELPASECIINSLMADASARRKATLLRLKEACSQIGGKKPIKLADIEGYIANAYGKSMGPKAQSISNEKSLELGMYHYVEACNRERQAAGRGVPLRGKRVSVAKLADRVEVISDIDLRADMRDVIDRLAISERNLARAKTLFKTLQNGVDFDAVLTGRVSESASSSNASIGIEPTLVAALENLLSILVNEDALARCGLTIQDGRVRRRVGTKDELISTDILKGLVDLCEALGGRKARLEDGGGS